MTTRKIVIMENSTFKPPKSLIFGENIHEHLQKIKKSFEIYLIETGLVKKTNETKVAIFARDVFHTFKLTDSHKKNTKRSQKPSMNIASHDRYKFFTRIQK